MSLEEAPVNEQLPSGRQIPVPDRSSINNNVVLPDFLIGLFHCIAVPIHAFIIKAAPDTACAPALNIQR
ncbi:hypothetical protein D3C73_1544770 [compost metagenome]